MKLSAVSSQLGLCRLHPIPLGSWSWHPHYITQHHTRKTYILLLLWRMSVLMMIYMCLQGLQLTCIVDFHALSLVQPWLRNDERLCFISNEPCIPKYCYITNNVFETYSNVWNLNIRSPQPHVILMAQCKSAVSPLLMHQRYCSISVLTPSRWWGGSMWLPSAWSTNMGWCMSLLWKKNSQR